MKADNTWREHVVSTGNRKCHSRIRWMINCDTVISFRKTYLSLSSYYVACWIRSAYEEIKEAGIYIYIYIYIYIKPIPLAARSKAWVWAVRLLGLWVRIPPGVWISVCCECCVLPGRGLCIGLITRPGESDRVWCVQWVWSRNPVRGGHDPELDRSATEKNYIYIYTYTHTHTA